MNFSLKCFPFHKWGNWETTQTGDIIDSFWAPSNLPIGKYVEQKKTCQICGKVKLREEQSIK